MEYERSRLFSHSVGAADAAQRPESVVLNSTKLYRLLQLRMTYIIQVFYLFVFERVVHRLKINWWFLVLFLDFRTKYLG